MNEKRNIMYQQLHAAKERGQALLLIAVLMVAMLGALGLAIDGGGMFLLWRDAQNAADAAALQAAFAYCTSDTDRDTEAIAAGEEALNNNGFVDSGTINTNDVDPVTELVVIRIMDDTGTINPQAAVTATQLSDAGISDAEAKSTFIIRIQEEKPSYFIRVINPAPLFIRVTAIGSCNPGGNFLKGVGAMGMGGDAFCSDPASTEPVSFSGARQHMWSVYLYSNDELSSTGANLIFHNGGGVIVAGTLNSSFNGVDGSGTAIVSEPVEKITDYTEFPVLYEIQWFAPPLSDYAPSIKARGANGGTDAGVIWDAVAAIEAATPGANYLHYPGDGTIPDNGGGNLILDGTEGILEGLLFVYNDLTNNYEVEFKDDFTIGPLGLTVVTNGRIDGGGNVNDYTSSGYRGFTSLQDDATSIGVGTASLSFFTTYNNEVDAVPAKNDPDFDCGGGGGSNAALSFSGPAIWGNGIVYAPYGYVNLGASAGVFWCGSIISMGVNNSAARFHLFGGNVPSDTELINDGDLPSDYWFVTKDYENTGCEFFEDNPANFGIGDLAGN